MQVEKNGLMNFRLYIKLLFFAVATLFSLSAAAKEFTVVIDAGHGGKDYGALGARICEKDVNLAVAKQLGNLINSDLKGVKVVLTRSNDTFITLQNRAEIANKNNGDLFISIHCNSVDKKAKNRSTINGASTYVLGLHKTEDNLEVAKRENSVIVLEDDYTTKYEGFDPNSSESYIMFELNQSKHMSQSVYFASNVQTEMELEAKRKDNGVRQAGFWVLAKTAMPAVLVELDFICNPTQETFLASKSGQEMLANSIFNAVKSYKQDFDKRLAANAGKNIRTEVTKNGKELKETKETKETKPAKEPKQEQVEQNIVAANTVVATNTVETSHPERNSDDITKPTRRNKSSDIKVAQTVAPVAVPVVVEETPTTKEEVKPEEVAKPIEEVKPAEVAKPVEEKKAAEQKPVVEKKNKKKRHKTEAGKSNYNSLADEIKANEINATNAEPAVTAQINSGDVEYRVQLIASPKKIDTNHPDFKGLSPISYYQENGLYKYTYGSTTSEKEAQELLKKAKTSVKGAFVVKFQNGQRIK